MKSINYSYDYVKLLIPISTCRQCVFCLELNARGVADFSERNFCASMVAKRFLSPSTFSRIEIQFYMKITSKTEGIFCKKKLRLNFQSAFSKLTESSTSLIHAAK